LDSFGDMGAVIARKRAGLLPALAAAWWFLLAPWAAAQPTGSAPADRAVVHPGDSEAAIVKRLGPGAVVEGAGRTFMMYPEGRIILEDDHAVEIPPALRAPVEMPVIAPVPVAAVASPPPVAATPPVVSAPAAPTSAPVTPAPLAKPVAAAVPAAAAKPATPPASPAAAPIAGKPLVPTWVWVSLVLALVLGGLKYWDYRAKQPSAPEATAPGGDAPWVGIPIREDVPVASVDPTLPSEMVTEPMMVEPPESPEPEPVRVKIGLRPAPAVEAPPSESGATAEEEAPRSLRLTRKAPGPGAGDQSKG
jgi:hypothetical protein